eukprot:Phypoly_transcript_11407.p1 GENE.Phypoly_transcript_11407~~Phypoly_transcript_11407.p1  ORF type:complete len:305 (-),score=52.42 Phypoly_transcript_11407:216-1130(-)
MVEEKKVDFTFRVVIIGDACAGKTTLMLRYANGVYPEDEQSCGMVMFRKDFVIKDITLDGHTVRLYIWDTNCIEKFRSVDSAFYRNANIVLFACQMGDIYESRAQTLKNLELWWKEVNYTNSMEQNPVQVRAFVGTKMERYPNFTEKREKFVFKNSAEINPSDFASLPPPVFLYMLKFLPATELSKLELLSTQWFRVMEDETLWHNLLQAFLAPFPNNDSTRTFPTWKQEYKNATYKGVRKSDLEEQGKNYGVRTYFTSSKTGTNVSELFEDLITILIPISLAENPPPEKPKEKKRFFGKLFKK